MGHIIMKIMLIKKQDSFETHKHELKNKKNINKSHENVSRSYLTTKLNK